MNSRIAFLPAADDGCALYRMWMTYLRTPNSRYVRANDKGLVSYDDFADCQIGVVQRLASDKNYETLQTIKQIGMKVVFDLDDDMWSVQASNPAKEHLKVFKDYERGFMTCATICDVITVSTTRLKSVVETQIGRSVPIKVVGNAMDLSLLRPSPVPKADNKIVIGWAGSNTHIADLAQMGRALDITVYDNPRVHLHFIGMNPPGKQLAFHNRVWAHGWVPVKEYHTRLSTWNWDIGIAPLDNNRFNRSKSAVKMIELGALKKPCLCSPVQPYLEFTSLHPELKWLICETENDWIYKLNDLVNIPETREYYGNIMYEVVRENYNMEKRITAWQEAFRLAEGSVQ